MVVFGAPSDPRSLRRFQQFCPNAHFLNGWGLTETCPPNTVIPLGSKNIESVGRPAPWVEVKIFGVDDKELPQGAVGEGVTVFRVISYCVKTLFSVFIREESASIPRDFG